MYKCPECGNEMIFEDENEFYLVCENCGYGTDTERYGMSDEEYDNLYPTKEEYLMSIGEYYGEDEEEDGDGEYYDPEVDGMYNED